MAPASVREGGFAVTHNPTSDDGFRALAFGEWSAKCTRIGALLGGVAGFFYAAYITATSPALGWADMSDSVESVAAVVMNAAILGTFCIAVGAVGGLVLGIVAFPLRSFVKTAKILRFEVDQPEKRTEKRDRAS